MEHGAIRAVGYLIEQTSGRRVNRQLFIKLMLDLLRKKTQRLHHMLRPVRPFMPARMFFVGVFNPRFHHLSMQQAIVFN